MRSFAETWYQLGFTFHAGGPDLSSKHGAAIGFLGQRHDKRLRLIEVLAEAFAEFVRPRP